jgi:hypothetical protein
MLHDRGPAQQFRAPRREPKLGTFHRTAHGMGVKSTAEAPRLKLSGPPMSGGEQKLGEGTADFPLSGSDIQEKHS